MATEDFTWEKKYPAYIVNRCLSYHYDTLIAANEMNGYHFLPKNMQYHFLLNIVRKKNRFAKFLNETEKVRVCKRVLWYSNEKAKPLSHID